MTQYGLSQRTINVAAATAAWEVRSTSTNKPKIMELGFSHVTTPAVLPVFGIGRPAAVGTVPTIYQSFLDESDGNGTPSLTTGTVAWGVAPTVPTNFNRRVTTSLGTGGGIILTFPRGFGIPVSSSMVIWIISVAVLLDIYAVVDE